MKPEIQTERYDLSRFADSLAEGELGVRLANVFRRELGVTSLEELVQLYLLVGYERFRIRITQMRNVGEKSVTAAMQVILSQPGITGEETGAEQQSLTKLARAITKASGEDGTRVLLPGLTLDDLRKLARVLK